MDAVDALFESFYNSFASSVSATGDNRKRVEPRQPLYEEIELVKVTAPRDDLNRFAEELSRIKHNIGINVEISIVIPSSQQHEHKHDDLRSHERRRRTNSNNSNNDNDNNNADDSFSNKDSIQPKRTTTMPSASQTDKSKMHENSDSKTSITNNIKNGRGKNKEKDTNTNINKEDKQLDSPWIDETLDTKSSTATTTATITTATSSSTRSGLLIDKWCPNSPRYIGAEELNFWVASINSLSENTQTINRIFNYLEVSFPSIEESSLSSSSSSSSSFQLSGESGTIMNHTDPTLPTTKIYGSSAFRLVTEATNNINEMIEWFFANDWLLKFLVLVLNVINGLLLANVYFLSKNNIVHAPTRLYVAYVLLPLFVFAAISIVVVAVATGVAVLINSDFCSGGTTGSGSPQGTLEDFIMTLQQQNLHNAAAGTKDSVPNGALDIAYDAVDYFWTGCLTENPLQFLDDFSNDVDDASAKLNQITALLPDTVSAAATVTASTVLQPEQNENIQTDTTSSSDSIPFAISTLERLNKACQRDMSFLPPAISDLESHVDRIRTNIHQLSDTISCGQISPILRRVSHGAICVETPYGLTILWGCSFGIGILCFVLLTVRAALYNSVKYKKQRPTKPRRIVEKEFEEYKQFMGQYYGENTTNKWKLDGISLPPTKLEFEFDIEMKRTFDTVSPTSGSFGNDSQDGGSEKGGIHNRGNDDDDNDDDPSYGSSYDSEISDDEKSIDSSEISAIGSLLSDTKSIAMHTIHSLRNVKSLLSSAVKKTFHPHIINSQHHNGSGLNHNDGFGDYKTSSQAVRSIFDSDEKGTIARRINFDDDDSHEDSITDDSLYLPTVASDSGSNLGKISLSHNLGLRGNGQMYKKKALLQDDDSFYDEEGLDEDEDERQANALFLASNRLKQVFTPSNLISALSPAAPRKALPFLARTLYNRDGRDGEYNNEELTALVRPKQLANLVPFRSREKYTIPQGKVSRNTKIQRKGIPLNNTPIRQSVEGKKDEKITKALKSSFPSTPLSSSSLNDHSYNHSSKYNKRNLARGKSAKSSASVQHDERGRQERR
mmetsp:Transcript_18998/g.41282  ORF Transcript_18998/g.41282 Transcript_18998/m.41282 type:complete len:1064 (+) Transcript_18998:138-3329(+)